MNRMKLHLLLGMVLMLLAGAIGPKPAQAQGGAEHRLLPSLTTDCVDGQPRVQVVAENVSPQAAIVAAYSWGDDQPWSAEVPAAGSHGNGRAESPLYPGPAESHVSYFEVGEGGHQLFGHLFYKLLPVENCAPGRPATYLRVVLGTHCTPSGGGVVITLFNNSGETRQVKTYRENPDGSANLIDSRDLPPHGSAYFVRYESQGEPRQAWFSFYHYGRGQGHDRFGDIGYEFVAC